MMTREKMNVSVANLPVEAFALIGNPDNPETWMFPHHRKGVHSAVKRKLDIEKTVDWDLVSKAVSALYYHYRSNYPPLLKMDSGEILLAAGHLAEHYRKADKPLPDILAALV